MEHADLDVEDVERDARLSELSTHWTMLFNAQHGTPEQANEALRMMMLRYSGAVHRYFLKTVGDEDAAKELDQEFAVRFLKGSFLKYDPQLGRFRDYVKRAVRNLMLDHHRGKGKTQRLDTELQMAIIDDSPSADSDEEFINAWRSELLDRAWNSLEELEQRKGHAHYTILKYRMTHPRETSEQMAKGVAPAVGGKLTAAAFRNRLKDARQKWVEFLIKEVEVSLSKPTPEAVEEELAELRLLHLCKPVMDRLDLKKKDD